MSMTIEEKKAKKAAYMKAYNASEAGKASKATYRATEAGKTKEAEYAKKYYPKYYATECGKINVLKSTSKYQAGEAGKVKGSVRRATEAGKAKKACAHAKYYNTESGRATIYANIARRRCSKLQRTPPWAKNDPRIKEIYRQARLWGMEVDHVLPLQGKLVSGLHCWENLQLLHKSVNRSKSNQFVPK